jgi:hypothetical protein
MCDVITPPHATPRHTTSRHNVSRRLDPRPPPQAPADVINVVLALVTAGYALNLYWAKEIMQKIVGGRKGKPSASATPTLTPLGEKTE